MSKKFYGLPEDKKAPAKEQANMIAFGSRVYPLYKNPITSSEFQKELHFLRRKDFLIGKGINKLEVLFLNGINNGHIAVKKEKLQGANKFMKEQARRELRNPAAIRYVDNSSTNDTSSCGEVLNPFTLRMIDVESRTAKKFLNGKIKVPTNRRDIVRLVRKTATEMIKKKKLNSNVVIDITTLSNFMKEKK
jgi:hypothetical protein